MSVFEFKVIKITKTFVYVTKSRSDKIIIGIRSHTKNVNINYFLIPAKSDFYDRTRSQKCDWSVNWNYCCFVNPMSKY